MSIEAKELRIGNWYQNKSFDKKLKYKQISYFQDIGYVATYCKPIPLTEEWLVKFGFEKAQDEGYLELDVSIGLSIIWRGYLAIEVNGYITSLSEKEQIYVHELQNLVHALTGEELTLKQTENI